MTKDELDIFDLNFKNWGFSMKINLDFYSETMEAIVRTKLFNLKKQQFLPHYR